MKRCLFIILITAFVAEAAIHLFADSTEGISISGQVRRPMFLKRENLRRMNPVTVKLNEITRDKTFHGVFQYTGVPLKSILDLAEVGKDDGSFPKLVDLAVIVKNRDGARAILSWGEIAYRQSADIIIANDNNPVMPMKKCGDCHKSKSEYEKWWAPLERQVGLPKLVIATDFYSDRCIENITSIEVIDLEKTAVESDKKNKVKYSPSFAISGNGKSINVKKISSFKNIDINARQVGDGKGFHGFHDFSGAPLFDLLRENAMTPGLDTVLVLTSCDGYRSLVSAGELLLNPLGKNIIIADRDNGKPIETLGKFNLIIPDDHTADRWTKALEKIEIVSFRSDPKIYIIGVGCGDTGLVTLDAVSRMAAVDVFVCTDDIKNRFSSYMGNKPILFDPLMNLANYLRKKNPATNDKEIAAMVDKNRARSIRLLKEAFNSGKKIGFLEYGDPTIYGSWTYWIYENFRREDVEVVPGISSFNAASAMIGKNVAVSGSVILTVPNGIKSNEAMVKAIADHGDILVVFVGLLELKNLMPIFEKYYRKNTPVSVIYTAGYAKKGRLVESRLDKILTVVENDREKFLGLIYIMPEKNKDISGHH